MAAQNGMPKADAFASEEQSRWVEGMANDLAPCVTDSGGSAGPDVCLLMACGRLSEKTQHVFSPRMTIFLA